MGRTIPSEDPVSITRFQKYKEDFQKTSIQKQINECTLLVKNREKSKIRLKKEAEKVLLSIITQ